MATASSSEVRSASATWRSHDLATMQATGAPGFDEVGQDLVVLRLDAGPARRAEGDQRRGVERELLLGPGEELDVLGVGAGPAALDVGDAEMVELLGHAQLVVDRERQPLLLAAVAQDRVEDVDRLGELGHHVVVRVRGVAVGVRVLARRRGRGSSVSVDIVQPFLVLVDLAADGGEVGLLDLLGDRPGLARADRRGRRRRGSAPPRPPCRSGTPRRPGTGRCGRCGSCAPRSRGRGRSSRPSSG